MVEDGAGGAIISWKDKRNEDYDIYAQRISASGLAQWVTDGVPLCTAIEDQEVPIIVSDDAGGAIVLWEDNRGTDLSVYAQKIDSSGVTQWTLDGVSIGGVLGYNGESAMCTDGAGGAIVAWGDIRTGGFDIYAQRVDALGAVAWWEEGVALCRDPARQFYAAMASDGTGGAMVSWTDDRNGNYDVYAQRVNEFGCVGVPGCCLTPDMLDFGTVAVGTTEDLTFAIENHGETTVTGNVVESCDHYSIVSGAGPYSLAPGEIRAVTVRFEPLYPDTHVCVIETGESWCSEVSCTGVAVGTPSCSAYPASLDFGLVHVSEKAVVDFTIVNDGTTILSGTVGESCDQYTIAAGEGPYTLYPGESVTVTVWFEPIEKGEHTCIIETGNAECPGVSCSGRGTGPMPNNNGKWALHFAGPHNSKTNTCDLDIVDCQDLVVDAPSDAGRYDIYVIAIDVEGIVGTRYGIECDGPIYFYGWTNCADLELPSYGWPGCGEDNAQVWSNERVGPHVTVGILDLYTYGGSVSLSTCADSRVGFAEWCDGTVPNPICTETTYSGAFGSVGFGVPGYNPCSMTPVGLAGFDASATEYGILVRWECGVPSVYSRFFVRRSTGAQEGDYIRLHEEAIEAGASEVGKYSYLDQDVTPGTLYRYQIEAIEPDGHSVVFGPYPVVAAERTVAYCLSQNFPNPFSRTGSTTIHFAVVKDVDVKIRILDAAGRLVRTLDRRAQRGDNWIRWDGTDRNGRRMAAGIYFYDIQAPGFSAGRKMLVVD